MVLNLLLKTSSFSLHIILIDEMELSELLSFYPLFGLILMAPIYCI